VAAQGKSSVCHDSLDGRNFLANFVFDCGCSEPGNCLFEKLKTPPLSRLEMIFLVRSCDFVFLAGEV
jgi:hypothetical protein